MVEATTGFRLGHKSILDVYKRWWYLDMLGMGIWDYPYTVPHLQVGGGVGVLGVDLSPNDIVASLLRLQQASDWISHPYWMYTKCFGTVICCVWAYGAALTMLGGPCRYIRVRGGFGGFRGGVVHANVDVGQKHLNHNILSNLLSVLSCICDATFMRCDRFQKSIAQTFPAMLATPTKYQIVFPNSFRLVWYVIPLCY